jgi:hypothetical protein
VELVNWAMRVVWLLVATVVGWIGGSLVGYGLTWLTFVVSGGNPPDLTITVIVAIVGAAIGIMLAGVLTRPRT